MGDWKSPLLFRSLVQSRAKVSLRVGVSFFPSCDEPQVGQVPRIILVGPGESPFGLVGIAQLQIEDTQFPQNPRVVGFQLFRLQQFLQCFFFLSGLQMEQSQAKPGLEILRVNLEKGFVVGLSLPEW